MAINMNQYIKGLGDDSDDAGMPFSVSHFENALNNANEQIMQQYIATEACFSVIQQGLHFFSNLKNRKRTPNRHWKTDSTKSSHKMPCSES